MPVVPGERIGEWKAYYWDRKDRKQRWLPLSVTRLWDDLPKEEAESLFEAWLKDNGIQRIRSRSRSVLTTDTLKSFVQAFEDKLKSSSAGSNDTIASVIGHINNQVMEFFVKKHGIKDVRRWYKLTSEFDTWLKEAYPQMSIGTQRKICQSLRRFGEFLARKYIIPQPWLIDTPKRKRGEWEQTPLPREVLPDEIYKFTDKIKFEHPKWALAILLGYFASLRPQEIFGLKREDFLTGNQSKAAKTFSRFKDKNLGSLLSISITKTRLIKYGQKNLTKTHYSKGIVHVWDVEGARRIGALLKGIEDGFLYGNDSREVLADEYAEVIKPQLGMFLYDLRRASSLYLGRTLGLDPFHLQDHLRHASMTTTLRYTRRPWEIEEENDSKQDFNDVG